MPSLRQRFFRRKHIAIGNLETPLKRCLTTFDLTLLGVGHMIGAGIYVTTGSVIRNTAGPSIIISFLLAGAAATLSALCYAEFGASSVSLKVRFPRAGSAYTYAYVGCGELWAFIIGWNLILEYILTAAAVARAWSGYLNSLLSNTIANKTIALLGYMGEEGSLLARYPDFIAAAIVILAVIVVCTGPKTATNFNTVFAIANLLVVSFVVIYGAFYVDFTNWTGTDGAGNSRFLPFGWGGMLHGAATSFFAYVGFDALATAGEEAKDPTRSIPVATYISMFLATLAYILMSGTLSLIVPYEKVHTAAAFSDAFLGHGANIAAKFISIGALCAMTTSMLGSVFALPRAVYSMASDGLLFSHLAAVNSITRVPVNACIWFGLLSAIISTLLDLDAIVDFLAIGATIKSIMLKGTLLAYSLVSASVIILRYQPAHLTEGHPTSPDMKDDKGGYLRWETPLLRALWRKLPPGELVLYTLIVLAAAFTLLGILISAASDALLGRIGIAMSVVVATVSLIVIHSHHENSVKLSFKVCLLPYIPAASLLVNILMMTHLSALTWIRLAVWMAIGLFIYLLYGMHHSKEERRTGNAVHSMDVNMELTKQ